MNKYPSPQLIIITVFGALLIFGLGYSIYVGYLRQVEPVPLAPVNLSIPATPSPAVSKKRTVDKPIKAKAVKVYPAAVKNNLKLPQVVSDNTALDVIASSQVPADDHPRTVTTLLDTDTGQSQTYVKRDPLPWLDDRKSGNAGIYAMYGDSGPFARLQVRQELFQVKALHFGAMVTVDQPLGGT